MAEQGFYDEEPTLGGSDWASVVLGSWSAAASPLPISYGSGKALFSIAGSGALCKYVFTSLVSIQKRRSLPRQK